MGGIQLVVDGRNSTSGWVGPPHISRNFLRKLIVRLCFATRFLGSHVGVGNYALVLCYVSNAHHFSNYAT